MAWIDTTRIGVIGHSYGGYMVNALVARTHEFRAAVAVSGLSDLAHDAMTRVSYGTDWVYAGQPRMELPIQVAPERYVNNSPVMFLDSVTTPLLLIHGVLDYTADIVHAEEMFQRLASRHKIVRLERYRYGEHENDDFLDRAWADALDWFDTYLQHDARGGRWGGAE